MTNLPPTRAADRQPYCKIFQQILDLQLVVVVPSQPPRVWDWRNTPTPHAEDQPPPYSRRVLTSGPICVRRVQKLMLLSRQPVEVGGGDERLSTVPCADAGTAVMACSL